MSVWKLVCNAAIGAGVTFAALGDGHITPALLAGILVFWGIGGRDLG